MSGFALLWEGISQERSRIVREFLALPLVGRVLCFLLGFGLALMLVHYAIAKRTLRDVLPSSSGIGVSAAPVAQSMAQYRARLSVRLPGPGQNDGAAEDALLGEAVEMARGLSVNAAALAALREDPATFILPSEYDADARRRPLSRGVTGLRSPERVGIQIPDLVDVAPGLFSRSMSTREALEVIRHLGDVRRATPQAADSAPAASPSEPPPPQAVRGLLQGWLKAWRAADLEAYAACYAEDARQRSPQQERVGRQEIVGHKAQLWKTSRPARVEIGAVTLADTPDGPSASFRLSYASSSGFAETGRKTLLLAPRQGRWVIVLEDWAAQ